MTITDNHITDIFKGSFISSILEIRKRLSTIKAFVFDWDGVFNNGEKDAAGSSPFNEIDAMGTNMLRFNYYLTHQKNPITAIITGEQNTAAFTLAKRECFHKVYFKIKHKVQAMEHLCKTYQIQPQEVCFVFDDVLDFSAASVCGLRMMIQRNANPLLIEFAIEKGLVDYCTYNNGSTHAIREIAELLPAIAGNYEATIANRMQFSSTYVDYLAKRNAEKPSFYTINQSQIIEQEI